MINTRKTLSESLLQGFQGGNHGSFQLHEDEDEQQDILARRAQTDLPSNLKSDTEWRKESPLNIEESRTLDCTSCRTRLTAPLAAKILICRNCKTANFVEQDVSPI
jgi:LSD1 subclass zinc finger protein